MNPLILVFCTAALCAALRGSGLTMLLCLGTALLVSLLQNWTNSKLVKLILQRKARQ